MKTKVEEIDGKFVATLEGEIIFRQKLKNYFMKLTT